MHDPALHSAIARRMLALLADARAETQQKILGAKPDLDRAQQDFMVPFVILRLAIQLGMLSKACTPDKNQRFRSGRPFSLETEYLLLPSLDSFKSYFPSLFDSKGAASPASRALLLRVLDIASAGRTPHSYQRRDPLGNEADPKHAQKQLVDRACRLMQPSGTERTTQP